MRFNKITAAMLAVVMAVSLFTFAPAAQAETARKSMPGPRFYYSAAPVSKDWRERTDLDALQQELFTALYNYSEAIDISGYNLMEADLTSLYQFIQLKIPEAFQLDLETINYSYDATGKVYELFPIYLYDTATYKAMYADCMAAANAMTADLEGLG